MPGPIGVPEPPAPPPAGNEPGAAEAPGGGAADSPAGTASADLPAPLTRLAAGCWFWGDHPDAFSTIIICHALGWAGGSVDPSPPER